MHFINSCKSSIRELIVKCIVTFSYAKSSKAYEIATMYFRDFCSENNENWKQKDSAKFCAEQTIKTQL